jgi:hypothetical protein
MRVSRGLRITGLWTGALFAGWQYLMEALSTVSNIQFAFSHASGFIKWVASTQGEGVLGLAGICMLVWSSLVRDKVESNAPSAPLTGAPEQKADSASDADVGLKETGALAERTTLPDGRTVISCTPQDIDHIYRTQTLAQINRGLDGKWLKLSGTVDNIARTSNLGVWVYLKTGLYKKTIVFRFENIWAEQLNALTIGADITVRGKMREADLTTFTLEKCELL